MTGLPLPTQARRQPSPAAIDRDTDTDGIVGGRKLSFAIDHSTGVALADDDNEMV